MRSILISIIVLLVPALCVFAPIAASGKPGGVGTEAIGGAVIGFGVFVVCTIVVAVNYAFGHWW